MLEDMGKQWNTAIIVAAGSGSRMGSETPKQFLLLDKREILSYSVDSFLSHPDIHEVIIVTRAEYLERITMDYPQCRVVLGGKARQDSVKQGLMACSPGTDKVLIHDAARPLIADSLIHECLNRLETFDGVAPAITPSDSMILMTDEGFQNLHRADLRIIQTPQCFKREVLLQAHQSGKFDTDEIGLVRQALPEAQITFIQGSTETMKITHAQDLDLIKRYLGNGPAEAH